MSRPRLRARLSAGMLGIPLVLGLAFAATVTPVSAAEAQPPVARPAVVRDATWLLRNTLTTGGPDLSFTYGIPSDTTLMGDWNGDGTVTPGTVAGSTWYLRNSNTPGSSDIRFTYGIPSDTFVVGDWNGDGIDTIGTVAGSTWYLRNTNSPGSSDIRFTYGIPSDTFIVGDWNGDGTDTIGTVAGYRWYLRNTNSAGFSDRRLSYGQAGDTPLVWQRAVTTVPGSLVDTEWTTLPTNRRVVALTFDAGANDDGVDKILSTLRAEGVAGTFFLTGSWIDRYPAQARRIATYFPVGNHSQSHPDFTTLTTAQIRSQLDQAESRIVAVTGQDPRPLFRFPLGARDARTIDAVNAESYGSVRWTVDTLGWQGTSAGRSVQSVVDRVVGTARPGQIVLMHVGSANDGSTLDADALPRVIRELRARGYGFVTVRTAT